MRLFDGRRSSLTGRTLADNCNDLLGRLPMILPEYVFEITHHNSFRFRVRCQTLGSMILPKGPVYVCDLEKCMYYHIPVVGGYNRSHLVSIRACDLFKSTQSMWSATRGLS